MSTNDTSIQIFATWCAAGHCPGRTRGGIGRGEDVSAAVYGVGERDLHQLVPGPRENASSPNLCCFSLVTSWYILCVSLYSSSFGQLWLGRRKRGHNRKKRRQAFTSHNYDISWHHIMASQYISIRFLAKRSKDVRSEGCSRTWWRGAGRRASCRGPVAYNSAAISSQVEVSEAPSPAEDEARLDCICLHYIYMQYYTVSYCILVVLCLLCLPLKA